MFSRLLAGVKGKTIFSMVKKATIFTMLAYILAPLPAYSIDPPSFLFKWGRGASNASGEFNYPSTVAVDPNTGNVYVADQMFNRIQKFDADGNFISKWAYRGVLGLAVDSQRNYLYAVSQNKHKVTQFDLDGNVLIEWGNKGNGDGEFNAPKDVAVDLATGNVFVLDSKNHRVQKFDQNGGFLTKWGSKGSGDGQFAGSSGPFAITVDSGDGTGYVYVTDSYGYQRIKKFDLKGNFILKWGSAGHFDSELRWARGLALDSLGNVYVADADNERVSKFSPSGIFWKNFRGPHNEAEGGFHPRNIAFNINTNEMYAAAAYAHRIDKFDSCGDYLFSWGHHEAEGEVFNVPLGITIDQNTGDVYVADYANHKIKRFDSEGAFILQFGKSITINKEYGCDGCISFPHTIAVNNSSRIVVLSGGGPDYSGLHKHVREFDLEGNFVRGWRKPDIKKPLNGLGVDLGNNDFYVANTGKHKIQRFDQSGNLITEWGSFGSGEGEFNFPAGVTINSALGLVYVVDTKNHRIQKFDRYGAFLSAWGSYGESEGEFKFGSYSGISLDSFGNVYVADTGNNRIQVFDKDGVFLVTWGSWGGGNGKFMWPKSVAVNTSSNRIYVLSGKVQVFSPLFP